MTTQAQNWYSEILIDPSFQGVNRLFVSSYENENDWRSCKLYYLLTEEIKKYNVMRDEIILF